MTPLNQSRRSRALLIAAALIFCSCERPALNASATVPSADASAPTPPCPGPDVPFADLPSGPCHVGAHCPITAYQQCASGGRGLEAAFLCSCPDTGRWDCAFQFQSSGSCPSQPVDAAPPDGAFSQR
jgi:hypothetical protein